MLSNNDIRVEDSCPQLLASLNTCLHSKTSQGKLNGLIVLQWLCQDCSDQLFNDQAVQWIKSTWTIVQKQLTSHLKLAFSILRILAKRAPNFPEVSRHLSTLVSSVIESLIKYADTDLHHLGRHCLDTIEVFLQTFPGSCGPTHPLLEKFILSNILGSGPSTLTTNFARCLSLMPRLGGGGKEGINHKSS